jgi:DNA polymerase-3 subunit delta'
MSFKDIKGQEVAVAFLKKAIIQQAIPPTFVFEGPKGTGRKLTAKTFAKALNCYQHNDDSCDNCTSCKAIDANVHPNMLIIDGKDKAIGIDDVRKVINSSFIPVNEGFKVNIFDGLDNATEEAFSSMLKYFEEPPEKTVNIIIVENPDNLPETVRSRSIEIKFRPLNQDIIHSILANQGVDERLLDTLSHISLGSLEQIKPYLKDGSLEKRNELINNILRFMSNEGTAAEIIEKFQDFYGKDITRENLSLFLEETLNIIYDVLLVTLSKEPDRIINVDFLGYMADRFYTFDIKKVSKVFKVIEKGKNDLLTNANPTYIIYYVIFGIRQAVK